MSVLALLLVAQVGTFVGLGGVFLVRGETRLGVAQVLLAVVQGVVYSGGAK